MVKGLVRYTIGGNPKNEGLEILRLSLNKLRNLIGDKFDFVVCFNNIKQDLLKLLDVELVDQTKFCHSLTVPPNDVAWKLYPPRLRKSAHEIFIDNDIIIDKIPKELMQFIDTSDSFIYTEGLHTTTSGRFKFWPKNETFNSGFFGIPPDFDFNKEIEVYLKDGLGWSNRFDEQGLVGTIFFKQERLIKIGLNTIGIFESGPIPDLHGYHFVKTNYKTNDSWDFYKRRHYEKHSL